MHFLKLPTQSHKDHQLRPDRNPQTYRVETGYLRTSANTWKPLGAVLDRVVARLDGSEAAP